MFDRFNNLMKGMLNKGMNKLETPEVLAEEAEKQLNDSLKQVKEALMQSMTREKLVEKQANDCAAQIEQWQKRAMVAAQQNNDEIARQCLQKKVDETQKQQMLQQQFEEAQKTSAALKDKFTEIDRQMQDFQRKKKELIARANAGQAVAKAKELAGGATGGSMDQWEQKILEKEAKNSALNQMNSDAALDGKFKDLDKHMEVEDELAALKGQLAQPKLIVDDVTNRASEDKPSESQES